MNFLIKLIVVWLGNRMLKPVERRLESYEWKEDDANELKSFLNTETGLKLLNVMKDNSNRCLSRLLKDGSGKAEEIKAEANAWLMVKGMIEMMAIAKKQKKPSTLNGKELDEIFSRIISNSSRVSRSSILTRQ